MKHGSSAPEWVKWQWRLPIVASRASCFDAITVSRGEAPSGWGPGVGPAEEVSVTFFFAGRLKDNRMFVVIGKATI